MKQIRLEQVSRHFGKHFALHRVDLTFKAGSITAVVGANGAGKTTLLNILATLDKPSSGKVRYDTFSWDSFARRGRGLVGWVSHAPLVYPDLTGRENLTFYADMHGIESDTKACDAWLERVALLPAADKLVQTYSRGMIQRLTIARSLLNDPRLVILDEPLTGLDRSGRGDITALFKELRDRGKILILSTHDLHSLAGLCDDLVVLRKGKVAHKGNPTSARDIIATYEAHA
jgi:heme exporter protein A